MSDKFEIHTDDYAFWHHYFDLDRNYKSIRALIKDDETLLSASEYGKGIHILNQDPWETLCSFIISQCNNIPRIKKIINSLCEKFGKQINETTFAFPNADDLAFLKPQDLDFLHAGYRAEYILNAATAVSTGALDINYIKTLDTNSARNELLKLKGVGNKVADCTLLFGFNRLDCFPVDVWVNRALTEFYNGKMPNINKDYAGLMQQYLFYYIRKK